MNYQELAGHLNAKVTQAAPRWSSYSNIWNRDDTRQRPSLVHLTYSAVLAVIGETPVQWASAEVAEESTSPDMPFTLTFWTADLAVQAIRPSAVPRPTVTVSKRTALTGLEVLSAPLLTTSDWSFQDGSVAIKLTYPAFEAVLRDWRGDDLLAALPQFVEELT